MGELGSGHRKMSVASFVLARGGTMHSNKAATRSLLTMLGLSVTLSGCGLLEDLIKNSGSYSTGGDSYGNGDGGYDTGDDTSSDTGSGTGSSTTNGMIPPMDMGCEPTTADTSSRALMENDRDVLNFINMDAIMSRIATNSGLTATPALSYNSVVDTSRTNGAAHDPVNQHCDDFPVGTGPVPPGNFGGFNGGFPIECPRDEGRQIDNLRDWFPIAAVNRFDLAAEDGSHCGEQRIIMANNSNNRFFFIFEAQIPNPNPSCGADACRPVAEFWENLATVNDKDQRRTLLQQAFFDGDHPDLSAAGFGAFMSADNMTFGTGQLRTNNFDQRPWTLREFKFVRSGRPGSEQLRVERAPVTSNAHGPLWNDLVPGINPALAARCRQAFIDAVGGLLDNDVNLMAFQIPRECEAAESRDDISNNYPFQLAQGGGRFEAQINDALNTLGAGARLNAVNIAERARFAGSCIGCHQQSNFADLGDGIIAPLSAGFVHVNELSVGSCDDGVNNTCFQRSPALNDSFLPFRERVLEDFLTRTSCSVCEPTEPTDPPIVVPPPRPPVPPVGPRPPVGPPSRPSPGSSLPKVDADHPEQLERLREMDAQKRSGAVKTISGRPYGAGH